MLYLRFLLTARVNVASLSPHECSSRNSSSRYVPVTVGSSVLMEKLALSRAKLCKVVPQFVINLNGSEEVMVSDPCGGYFYGLCGGHYVWPLWSLVCLNSTHNC